MCRKMPTYLLAAIAIQKLFFLNKNMEAGYHCYIKLHESILSFLIQISKLELKDL